MNTWVKRALIAIPALIILIYGAIFVYAKIINDPDPKLDTNDLSAAVLGDSSSTTPTGDTVDPTTSAPVTIAEAEPTESSSASTTQGPTAGSAASASSATDDSSTTDVAASPADVTSSTNDGPGPTTGDTASDGTSATSTDTEAADFDGVWAIAEGSEFGYRVQEVLGGVETTATGRGSDITGSITIAGTTVTDGSFEVYVATITSDRSNRDNQFKGRIMSTDEFPTATFVLTEPLEFGAIPSGEEQIVSSATGDLTLHGTTNTVTFDVLAQATDDRIGVLGEIPVVFADYDIPDPSAGPARVGDDGLLEFILVFEPSDDAANTSGSTASTETVTSESSTATDSSADSVAGFRAAATASTVPVSTPEAGAGVCTTSDSSATSDPTAEDGAFDGTWAVTDQSTFGYRVQEMLGGVDTGATGRRSQIRGRI